MNYTVRFAHLAEPPALKIGQSVHNKDVIGIMGSTGQSTGAHLHIDCVYDLFTIRYQMHNLEKDSPQPAPRQLNYFIDSGLFDCAPRITTYYCDPLYQEKFGKVHFGYDVVPTVAAKKKIHWNRSMPGRVVQILDDPTGYGHCVYIAFDA